MNASAVTIDFHNTLVECDAWFELEVRTLVSEVHRRITAAHSDAHADVDYAAIDQAYRSLRLAIHDHGMEVAASDSVHQVLSNQDLSYPADLVDETVDTLMRETLASARPVEGSQALLRDLRDRNVKLAVVSSAVHHDFLLWALAEFEMLEYFDLVATSASTGYYKSRPEIYLNTLAAISASPATAIHLGDSLRFDVGGASAAGLATAWFDRGDGHGVYAGHPVPDVTITNLETGASPLLECLKIRTSTEY